MEKHDSTMINSRTTIKCWKKSILFKVLKRLKHGNLQIYEDGHFIESFGNANSTLKASINVLNKDFYSKLLFAGSIGAGESYIDKDWDSPNLTDMIRIFARNLEILDDLEGKMGWLTMPLNKISHYRNKNSAKQARVNISSHYDLGNILYKSFLDESMLYSSAIYKNSDDSLEAAQENKLKVICEKLHLNKNDHVLEIGTGWGALAIYMVKNYDCHVTTTTISEEQHSYTKKLIEQNGLNHKITLLKKDYRDLEGQYSKLVSIEMIEAVGKDYMESFFSKCQALLKDDGLMLLQAITISDQRMKIYANSVDFIQKHIFPGGFLPSAQLLLNHVSNHTNMAVYDVHDIGQDYAATLKDWLVRFEKNFPEIEKHGYDSKFFRLWKFYLEYCAGGFREKTISTVQVLLTGRRNLDDLKIRK